MRTSAHQLRVCVYKLLINFDDSSLCVHVCIKRARRVPSKSREVIKSSSFVRQTHASTLFSGVSHLFGILLNDVAAAAAAAARVF